MLDQADKNCYRSITGCLQRRVTNHAAGPLVRLKILFVGLSDKLTCSNPDGSQPCVTVFVSGRSRIRDAYSMITQLSGS